MIEYSDENISLDLVTKMKVSLLEMFYSLFRAAEKELKRLKNSFIITLRGVEICSTQLILYELSYA